MSDQVQIKDSVLRLYKGDITDYDIHSFVYYAQHDLKLGSGFGNAITMRGGPSVQEELNGMGPLKTTEVAVSAAGNMKAERIIHAVGPRFQEEDLEAKLKTTVQNVLEKAEAEKISHLAFPPMGTGFYGVPLDTSAEITLKTIAEHLKGETQIKEVVVCLNDSREYKPFQDRLATIR